MVLSRRREDVRTVSLGATRRRLALLWMVWAASLVLLVFVQTVLGRYADRAREAWDWLLPTIVPLTGLLVGVVATDALSRDAEQCRANRSLYGLSLGLSILYLSLVSLVLLAAPFSAIPPLRLMANSVVWLGGLQGIVAASIGAFFSAGTAWPVAAGPGTSSAGSPPADRAGESTPDSTEHG